MKVSGRLIFLCGSTCGGGSVPAELVPGPAGSVAGRKANGTLSVDG